MKNLLNVLFLFPILVYVLLLLINSDLLSRNEAINLFWIADLELPFISISTIFFIAYIFLMYFSWKFSSFFTNTKIKKNRRRKIIIRG